MRCLVLLLLPTFLVGCGSSWSVRDEDGDGKSILDGDCYDSPDGGAGMGPDASETWYDGVDGNCDGLSDFDKDGDGFESAEFGGTDCWDDPDVLPDDFEVLNGFPALMAADVHPDAEDISYDGIDANCGGESDFDEDGDGYDTSNSAFRQGDGSLGDDCYDSADEDTYPSSGTVEGELDADAINPGADDTWYDGTDQNCDGQSDYDQDGDGYNIDAECDDTNAEIFPNPSVEEIWYNDVDENCDGNLYDKDFDGFDSAAYGGDDCWDDPDTVPTGFDAINGLSQPASDEVYPGATDTPYDGVDGDCGGDSDFDADDDGVLSDEWPDRDGALGLDCDDSASETYPSAPDTWYDGVDSDCAGDSDYDADGDGFDAEDEISTGTDCDDVKAAVNPDENEVCGTSYDDNCDGALDLEDASGCSDWYYDSDGDGYGTTSTQCWCDAQTTSNFDATLSTDCNDTSATISPAGSEVCDAANTDEDCDGVADNNDSSAASSGKTRFYHDDDEDGYGDETHAGSLYCDNPTASSQAWVTDNTDCDDVSSADHPGASEVVGNDDDDDCDGGEICYDDDDDDGYLDTAGDTRVSADADCSDPNEGKSTDPTTDCDDSDSGDHPGATEVVGNEDDEDCDGGEICYEDDDNDGYLDTTGDTRVSTDTDCADPYEGKATDLTTDCDDSDSGDYPSATEIVGNGDDEDCDGGEICYDDADNDGYLDTSGATRVSSDSDCSDNYEGRNTDPTTDCDDSSASISPAGTEICDASNTDEDCDGLADDLDSSVSSTGKTRYYPDIDGDEYGDENEAGSLYCDDPSTSTVEWATAATDCDDDAASINPGATEICDASNTDEDCDGLADDLDSSTSSSGKTRYYPDDDGDEFGDDADAGALYCDDPSTISVEWSTDHTDCDDALASINTSATEICDADNTDEDCDGLADDLDASVSSSGKTSYYPDDDDDGFGDDGVSASLYCDDPSAAGVDWSTDHTDCDDGDIAINTSATEVCDASDTDEDCDGLADDADPGVSSTGKTTWYDDVDGDGYGDENDAGALYCDDPSTASVFYADEHTDCNDAFDTFNPGAADATDGTLEDENCNGYVDEDDIVEGSVVFTEYFVDGVAASEWFELYNNEAVEVDLEGWTLTVCYDVTTNETLPYVCDSTSNVGEILDTIELTGLTIPAGGYVVLCNDASNFATPADCDFEYTLTNITGASGLQSDNGSVALELMSLLVDDINWWHTAGGDDWPQGAVYSVQFSSDLLDANAATTNDDYSTDDVTQDQWCPTVIGSAWNVATDLYGTPGAANEDCTP